MIYTALFYSCLSFLFSLISTPFFSFLAIKTGIVDNPDGKIKLHKKATPYLGGLSIFFPIIFFMIYFQTFVGWQYTGIILGLTILMIVGLLDDMYQLNPTQKFFGQCIAAIIFVSAGNYIKYPSLSGLYAYVITIFWYMTIINALNLVDIMDGLAGFISLGALMSFAVLAYIERANNLLFFTLIISGSLVGFLYYNKPRAKIYMGDTGSLFLGGCLGLTPFLLAKDSTVNIHEMLVVIILLGIPLAETALLILIRTYKRIPFYKASPDHFACYLRRKKWHEWKILSGVSIVSILLSFVAFCFFMKTFSCIATFLQLFLLLFFSIFIIYF